MLDDIKELFQNLLAPQLEGIKGDLRALDAKIDSLHTKMDARFETVDAKIDARFETVDARFAALTAKVDAIDTKVDSFRRELLAEVHRVEASIK